MDFNGYKKIEQVVQVAPGNPDATLLPNEWEFKEAADQELGEVSGGILERVTHIDITTSYTPSSILNTLSSAGLLVSASQEAAVDSNDTPRLSLLAICRDKGITWLSFEDVSEHTEES